MPTKVNGFDNLFAWRWTQHCFHGAPRGVLTGIGENDAWRSSKGVIQELMGAFPSRDEAMSIYAEVMKLVKRMDSPWWCSLAPPGTPSDSSPPPPWWRRVLVNCSGSKNQLSP